jgi:hypothetical protein
MSSNFPTHFELALTWPDRCFHQVSLQLEKIHTRLTGKLKKLSKSIRLSPLSWEYKYYWLQNASLLLDQKNKAKKLVGNWSNLHDEIFESWNKSEFANIFLKHLNQKKTFKKANQLTCSAVEESLYQMGKTIFKLKIKSSDMDPVFELGQFGKTSKTELIHLSSEQFIEFHTWDTRLLPQHLHSIIQSLTTIKTYSPESFEVFKLFTKRITPIKQKELVSYSLQSLPGHSFINLYHRDEIDLLDDLLHENGHHHLNHFLILYNPLKPKAEHLYYSPWRDNRRPLRGIYHAYLTFFFAQKLFYDLGIAIIKGDLKLHKRQREKVLFRFCEESLMLRYSAIDLKLAFKKKHLTTQGYKLFLSFESEQRKMDQRYENFYRKLAKSSQTKLRKLAQKLELQPHF